MTEQDGVQGTVRFLRHQSEVLRANPLGDPNIRDVIVYLPPGYQTGSDSYPSAYCLSGFTGRGRGLLNDKAFAPNLAERMDSLIADGLVRPMILVMPDCFTYYGGSQYINSTATGDYEDYLTREIVPFIDAELRTIADRASRAVMGISSGGYGSLIMGMRHADLFGMVCSIAGDAYFEYCLPMDFANAFRLIKGDAKGFMKRVWANEKRGRHDHAAINTIGMSACYSPNGVDFELPFDTQTGAIREDVWRRWLAHDPVRLVAEHRENLRSLNLLFIDAGTRDEFNLDIGARILSAELNDLGIPHTREEFDDGHFNISYRYNRSLELISQTLEVNCK